MHSFGAKLGTQKINDPIEKTAFLLQWECETMNSESTLLAVQSLQCVANAGVNPKRPRKGLVCYCFSKSRKQAAVKNEQGGERIHFYELLLSTDAEHGGELEGEGYAKLFESEEIMRVLGVGALNVPKEADRINSALQFGIRGTTTQFMETLQGKLLNSVVLKENRYNIYPKEGRASLIELRVKPMKGELSRDSVLKIFEKLTYMDKSDFNTLSSFVSDTWWVNKFDEPKDLNSRARRGKKEGKWLSLFRLDACGGSQATFSRSLLTDLSRLIDDYELLFTFEDWTVEDNIDLVQYFEESGFHATDLREIFAGYLIHPCYSQKGRERQKSLQSSSQGDFAPAAATSTDTGMVNVDPSGQLESNFEDKGKEDESKVQAKDVENSIFEIRRNAVSNYAETIIFSESEIDKRTGEGSGKRSPGDPIRVPLLHLMRKFLNAGVLDTELPMAFLYGHLERFRSLQRDAEIFNNASTEDLENDVDLAYNVQRLLITVSGLGYTLPADGRVPLIFEDLKLLIETIEKEFGDIVTQGKDAVANGGPIPYMALQEHYLIGSLVSSSDIGATGGVPICLLVKDCHYEPVRSLMGGRKYSFRISLEVLVALAGEFIAITFEQILEEWTGGRELDNLVYKPIKTGENLPEDILKRGKMLGSLSGAPSYLKYRGGAFFPQHVGSRSKRGAADSIHRLSSPGRLIVDTRRGLELGYSPASSVDDIGFAISQTVKVYRNIQRSMTESESEEKRQERLRSSGLVVWSHVPDSMISICWPLVVAFSLSTKQWGRVLVDGLEKVTRSTEAWSQLVLPDDTKEVLLAMAASTIRGQRVQTASSFEDVDSIENNEVIRVLERLEKRPRYTYRDVIETKGGGVLFLLYGPPGTGKTMSVESLASLFGRPLYQISFAELGSSVSELEERLNDVLDLAAHWGALVLLDEGDALVEKRTRGQLLLNSMTGVLLRLLENFEGSLFITSNRASEFDPAALSRVTLAVRYEPLKRDGKLQVWRNMIARVLSDEILESTGKVRGWNEAIEYVDKNFDLTRMSKFTGSGRSVGAVIRISIGLAEQRECTLSQEVVDDAIRIFEKFHSDLAEDAAEAALEKQS